MQQTRSSSNPSQYSWNAALKAVQNAQKMDEVFNKVYNAIEQHAALLKRDAAVRLKLWLTKLNEQTNNPVWKKNRNAHAKLLLNQLKQGHLEKPFNAAPPAGPLQTLPASLTYAFSLPRTSSTRSTIRSATSVASSQGSPGSNAADTPHLDDYIGRHASPQRMTSGGSLYTQDQGRSCGTTDAVERDSRQLSQQTSGLWGVESNPSRQPSIAARAPSPPPRQQSQSSQRSETLRSRSEESSKFRSDLGADPREDTRADARIEPRVQSGHVCKSPTRAPSRLRESTTEEAEVQYAAPSRHAHQSPARDSSAEEDDQPQRHHRQNPKTSCRAADADDDADGHQRRHSPRGSQPGSRQNLKGSHPHQFHHTAEEYFSRARVREALSPRKGSSHTRQYPTRARILDLHDKYALADEQEDDQEGHVSQRHHARNSGQRGAQVQLGGTNMRVDRGLQGGRRGDAIDLSDESWQPSKLELQARLGASKERQLELEWRLQQAEQKIAQAQAQQLAHQLAASQLPKARQVAGQQPRQQQAKKDRLKKDLGKLIDKYDKRQYRWGSPRKAASMDNLLPLDCRIGSSDTSFDDMAEIAAVLKGCSRHSPVDVGTGEHPLSQGPQEPALQGSALHSQGRRDAGSLSGGSSSASVASASDALQHQLGEQTALGHHVKGGDLHRSDDEAGRFAKKLHEFQKGTDVLRRQISLS